MRRFLLLLALVVGLAPACKKMDATATSPGYSYEDDGVAYGGMAAGLPAEREMVSFEYSKDAKLDEDYGGESPAQPTPVPMPEGEPPSPTEPPPRPDPAEQQPSTVRQIIYTATLVLSVYERDAVMEQLEAIPARFGGWVAARQDYLITLRVPAGRLVEVMDGLAELGLVIGKTLQAADVTAEYTDLASRIAVLEQLHAQLLVLLDQAKTVEESLKVRAELERVRLELESAKVRMRSLSEQIAFSTLTVSLVQRGSDEVLPASNDPFPWVDELGVESTEFR